MLRSSASGVVASVKASWIGLVVGRQLAYDESVREGDFRPAAPVAAPAFRVKVTAAPVFGADPVAEPLPRPADRGLAERLAADVANDG